MNLQESLEKYRDLSRAIAPARAELDQLKKEIKEHVLETGEVAEVDGAAISVRKGSVRHTWNNAKLEGFALIHPVILEARTTKETNPSVTIKVKK